MRVTETRIFRLRNSIASEYAIVSMPSTAWYWLDDLVAKKFPGGYKALMKIVKDSDDAESLSRSLRSKAQEHCEAQLATLYNLANDNAPGHGYGDLKRNPSHPRTPDLSARMPSCYWLFRFLPHSTYLTTVWERRNWHLKNGPKD